MIALSVAARAFLASAVIHASIAVVGAVTLADGSRRGTGAERDVTIDVDRSDPIATLEMTRVSPARDEPHPVVTAQEPIRFANVVVPAATNPSPVRRAASLHVARVAPSEGLADTPPAVVTAPTSTVPRFVMAFGTATREAGGRSKAGSASVKGGDDAETYPESGVSSRARLLEGRPPEYPAAARAAAVEAELPLEIVVDASGSVVDARPLQHVGYGLDEAALRAIREYRFVPAQRAGRGVSVRMRWVIDFRLD